MTYISYLRVVFWMMMMVLTRHLIPQYPKFLQIKKLLPFIHAKSAQNPVSQNVVCQDMSMLSIQPQMLKMIVKECALIVGTDECLPESCRNRFCESSFSFSENDAYELWYKLKPIVSDFDGDAERFYSQFYGLLVDNLLPQIFDCTTDANVILTEVGNHILLHLSGKDTKTVPAVKPSSITDKKLKCLQYVAGFVLHKLHPKFKFENRCHIYIKEREHIITIGF